MFDSVWWSTRTDVSICVMFALMSGESMATFLMVLTISFLCFHIWLMLKAMTTVEFCEKSLKKQNYNSSIYSIGCYGNACAVLGPNPLLWFFPISMPIGDGMAWERPNDEEQQAQNDQSESGKAAGASTAASSSGGDDRTTAAT